MNPLLHRAGVLALAWCAFAPMRAAEVPPGRPGNSPWRVFQTVKANYPERLKQQAITHGEARLRVSIDDHGRLVDALVVGCTHRDFGDEALRVVRLWRFAPGLENGEPIGVVGDIKFTFVIDGMIAVINTSGLKDDAPTINDPLAYGPENTRDLDRTPRPIHVVQPTYPREWSDRGIAGSATVEFYIDETGKARIPVVVSADQPLLGGAAVAAVIEWRFEPPTRGGQPVLVRAQQVFTFERPKK